MHIRTTGTLAQSLAQSRWAHALLALWIEVCTKPLWDGAGILIIFGRWRCHRHADLSFHKLAALRNVVLRL